MVLARVAALAQLQRQAVHDMSDAAATEFFYAIEQWAATVDDGREPCGLLNGRYELCLIECGSPAPWVVAAYDTQREQLVLAQLLTDRRAINCTQQAQHCAQALGEAVDQLDCYSQE
jgi:hypothetical protein